MARKKQSYRPYQRRANTDKTGFAQLYHDLLDSAAFRDLTPRQRLLYVYCVRESHGEATRDDPNHDSARFYMNRQVRKQHELYGLSDSRQFERDMSELIKHGLVDAVKSGYECREKNVYRLSARWQHWDTPSFQIPDEVMTTHMLRKRSKQDG